MSQRKNIKIQSRVDTKENWEYQNPILLDREIGYEKETGAYKIGNSEETSWNDLDYFSIGLKNESGGEVFNDYENNKAQSKCFRFDQTHVYTDTDYDLTTNIGKYYLTSTEGIEIGFEYTLYLSANYDLQGKVLSLGENYIEVDNYIVLNNSQQSMIFEGSYLFFPYHSEIGTDIIGEYAHAEGYNNIATSMGCHAEGANNLAAGKYAHVEGSNNVATYAAHAEGQSTLAKGHYSHAEGQGTKALSGHTHSEGYYTTSNGRAAHAEGVSTEAVGAGAHSEGYLTKAIKKGAHVEGIETIAQEEGSHAEGTKSIANGQSSHAEGYNTLADSEASHAENYYTQAIGSNSHAEGYESITGGYAFTFDEYDIDRNVFIFKIPDRNLMNTEYFPFVVAQDCSIYQPFGELYGYFIVHDIWEEIVENYEGYYLIIQPDTNMEEAVIGNSCVFIGSYDGTLINPNFQYNIVKIGYNAHAEGEQTVALGYASHAEGQFSSAFSDGAHAEGCQTSAFGWSSHAEGCNTFAVGINSHAEGEYTKAYGENSHVEGYSTQARGLNQHVQGRYNEVDYEHKYAHIVGNGDASNKSNAHTLDWDGNAWFAGNITTGEDNRLVPTIQFGTEELENGVSALPYGCIYFVIE